MPSAREAYWIAHVTVTDEAQYAAYRKMAAEAVAAHGGKFLARGGRYRQMEGTDRPWNTVAVFPSFEKAVECYDSPAYQAAVKIAARASERELVIVEAG
ncbi:DUF1330 domain-containing protein [Afifella sp. IM 167]|uniref:DUF1330 domain-containing protein n=1 Tax=Afifella sp. IM 167 TaxID=2033586 RepID=UPI001CCF529E|nr:DUF1330 domain-containing protein [Afifella sp. IM 167]MBZ8132695.1 hypothetical protein [Afifella sp. IM 167]